MDTVIHKLSSETINQIAAGEVIEDPASVVKELVENSIDAKAKNITVIVVGGGFQSLTIVDDGVGMSPEDALVSCERHATSKLVDIRDFDALQSLGFRGEALSSISSVSRFTLTTNRGSGAATQVLIEGAPTVKKASRGIGTTIEVASLFYNTPARKKFQSSPRASMTQIIKVMTRLALAHPEVSFKLLSGNEEQFHVTASSWEGRIADLLPAAYMDKSCVVEFEGPLIRGHGVLGLPSEARATRSGQYLFINGRSVTSPLVGNAVVEGYATRLQPREHPLFVLYIDIDPKHVDVNVHPQKREVRFTREDELAKEIRQGVHKALLKHEHVEHAPQSFDYSGEISQILENEEAVSMVYREEQMPERGEDLSLFQTVEAPLLEPMAKLGKRALVNAADFNASFPKWGVADGYLLIDLQEVARRLVYDAVYRKLQGEGESLAMQSLLFPITIEVSKDQAHAIRNHLSYFEGIGLSIREFGDDCFLIESLSCFYREEDGAQIMHEGLAILEGRGGISHKLKQLALLTSQKAQYPEQDLHAMMEKLMNSSSPLISPNGKNIFAHITEERFQVLFKEMPLVKTH